MSLIAEQPESAVATVPDDESHEMFERIDAHSRWAGVALVDARLLGSTAAILGDWDLQSTLLRRAIQEGAVLMRAAEVGGEPLLVDSAEDLQGFQRRLVAGSRGTRPDWVSRYLLPPLEEFATEQLMETARPAGGADLGFARTDSRCLFCFVARLARRRLGRAHPFHPA